jgi:hypothetical protein
METKTSTTGNCDLREAHLHPAWVRFILYCRELKHGEIDRLTIQDGVPVLAELTKKKVKFSS